MGGARGGPRVGSRRVDSRLELLRLRAAPRSLGRTQKWRPPCSTAGSWLPPPLGATGPGRRCGPLPRYCGPARPRFEGRQEKGRGGGLAPVGEV